MSAERRLSMKSSRLTSSQPSGSRAHSHAAKARGASLPPDTRKRVFLDCILLPSRKRRNTLTGKDNQSAGEQAGPSNLSRLESLLQSQNKPIGLFETIEEAYSKPSSSQRSRKKRKRVASSPAPPIKNSEPRASQQTADDTNGSKHSAETSEPAIGRVIGPMTPLSFVQLCYKRLREAESEPPKQVGDSPAHLNSSTAHRPSKRPRTQMQQETSSPPTLQQASGCLPEPLDVGFRSFAELSRATTEETVVAASVRDPSPLPPLPSTVPKLALPPAAPLQDDKRPTLLSPPPHVPPRYLDDTSGQEISYDVSTADFAFLDLPDVVTMPWEATPISYVDEGGKFQEQDVFLPPGISCLVEAMKHTLACERAALLNAEVRHDQELRRRLNAEHQVELLVAENMRLREALQKDGESISNRS